MSETIQIDPAVISCAAMLDGSTYPLRNSHPAFGFAKQEGLVIIYGDGDDSVCLGGLYDDQAYVEDGSVIICCGSRILPLKKGEDGEYWINRETTIVRLSDCERLVSDFEKAFHITVTEADKPYWSYELQMYVPCEYRTFNILENGDVYCEGIVFKYLDSIGMSDQSL